MKKKRTWKFLNNGIEYYFVIEVNDEVVGSGGFNFADAKTIGVLTWGILHPDFQRKSLGSTLLNCRIGKLKQVREVQKVIVRTSQSVYKFYEKSGFKLIGIVEDYWAKGYHLYDMEYVNDNTRINIR